MAVIADQSTSVAGTAPTFAAANNADQAHVGGGRVLIVKNGSGAEVDVTLVVPGNLPTGVVYPDRVYPVAAGAEAWIPLLPLYANSDGLADIDYESTTTVTRAVVKFGS